MGWIWHLFRENCPGCGICYDVCEFNAIRMSREMAYPEPVANACTGCQTCVQECPFDAIAVEETVEVA